jgi:DNA polymerase III epsilon subunit-like protein
VIVVDTETTGTDPCLDRIVEVAALRPDGTSFHRLLNPGVPVGESGAIHGLTDIELAACPRFADIAVDLAAFVGSERCAAYNARFDRSMLIAEYLRAGLVPPPWLHRDAHWFDPLVWARARDPYVRGAGRNKLGAVAKRLGVAPGTAHRAVGDCETTRGVIDALGIDLSNWDAQMMRQRVLSAEHEADFLRWLETKRKEEAA